MKRLLQPSFAEVSTTYICIQIILIHNKLEEGMYGQKSRYVLREVVEENIFIYEMQTIANIKRHITHRPSYRCIDFVYYFSRVIDACSHFIACTCTE